MAKRRPIPPKKRRTREHVIADLSVNHVERHALLGGCSVERVAHDYGYDLWVSSYEPTGEAENGLLYFQLKATEHLNTQNRKKSIPFAVDVADLRLWRDEVMPVILFLYEAERDRAYWLYIQAYFKEQISYQVDWTQRTVTVRIPKKNVLDKNAVARFVEFKRRIVAQAQAGVDHHEEDDRV